jgi:uncharacterized metal-binding protein YceD (DUF177 family)
MTASNPKTIDAWIHPSRLPRKGELLEGALDEAGCKAVGAELGILAVLSLAWSVRAKPWRKDGFALTGTVKGEVEQACVVTLDPVRQSISEDIDLRFLPEGKAKPRAASDDAATDLAFDAAPEDEPELYSTDPFDAAPLIIEHFALGLDPYPRKPGADFTEAQKAALAADADESPMARALRQWGKRPG